MWEILLAFPVMILAGVLQVTVFSEIHLINGNINLIMLILIAWSLNENSKYSWVWYIAAGFVMTYLSAMPLYGYFLIFGVIYLIILFLKKWIWQMPITLSLFTTMIGSIIEGGFSIIALLFQESSVNIQTSITTIVIPSMIMNLFASIPIYSIFSDIANTIYIGENKEE